MNFYRFIKRVKGDGFIFYSMHILFVLYHTNSRAWDHLLHVWNKEVYLDVYSIQYEKHGNGDNDMKHCCY